MENFLRIQSIADKTPENTGIEKLLVLSEDFKWEKLEKNNFHSSSRRLMNNHELYREFFKKLDELNLTFIKVKGHKKNSLKNHIGDIFNLVDKASRNALRQII